MSGIGKSAPLINFKWSWWPHGVATTTTKYIMSFTLVLKNYAFQQALIRIDPLFILFLKIHYAKKIEFIFQFQNVNFFVTVFYEIVRKVFCFFSNTTFFSGSKLKNFHTSPLFQCSRPPPLQPPHPPNFFTTPLLVNWRIIKWKFQGKKSFFQIF